MVGDRRSLPESRWVLLLFPGQAWPHDAIAPAPQPQVVTISKPWAESTFESAQPTFLGDYAWLTLRNGKVYGVRTEALPAVAETHSGRLPRPETVVCASELLTFDASAVREKC